MPFRIDDSDTHKPDVKKPANQFPSDLSAGIWLADLPKNGIVDVADQGQLKDTDLKTAAQDVKDGKWSAATTTALQQQFKDALTRANEGTVDENKIFGRLAASLFKMGVQISREAGQSRPPVENEVGIAAFGDVKDGIHFYMIMKGPKIDQKNTEKAIKDGDPADNVIDLGKFQFNVPKA